MINLQALNLQTIMILNRLKINSLPMSYINKKVMVGGWRGAPKGGGPRSNWIGWTPLCTALMVGNSPVWSSFAKWILDARFLSHPVQRKVTKRSSSQTDFNFLIMVSRPMDGFRGKLLSSQNQPDWLKYEGDDISKTPRNAAKLSVLV